MPGLNKPIYNADICEEGDKSFQIYINQTKRAQLNVDRLHPETSNQVSDHYYDERPETKRRFKISIRKRKNKQNLDLKPTEDFVGNVENSPVNEPESWISWLAHGEWAMGGITTRLTGSNNSCSITEIEEKSPDMSHEVHKTSKLGSKWKLPWSRPSSARSGELYEEHKDWELNGAMIPLNEDRNTEKSHRRVKSMDPGKCLSRPKTPDYLTMISGESSAHRRALSQRDENSMGDESNDMLVSRHAVTQPYHNGTSINLLSLQNTTLTLQLNDILGLGRLLELHNVLVVHNNHLPSLIKALIIVWEAVMVTILIWYLGRVVGVGERVVDGVGWVGGGIGHVLQTSWTAGGWFLGRIFGFM